MQEYKKIREVFYKKKLLYYTDIFSKPIWGDMGEDCASIRLTSNEEEWMLNFIRTQSGEPYPLSETVCNIIDQYEKVLNDNQLYDFLLLHNKLKEFQEFVDTNITTDY